MAGEKQTGVGKALDLDGKAGELADELRGEADAPIQNELFAGSSVFGEIKTPDGQTTRTGPGRPKGSLGKSTKELVKLIEATGRHPILAMAEIVATPIDVIARTLGCKKIEAAEYHRKVMNDLAPYVAQKLPTAIELPGANAGALFINLGAPVETGENIDQAFGKLLEGVKIAYSETEENQPLSDDDAGPSHGAPSHDEGK
ncbi:hypothetical protein [Oricola cellulosilytica]|uniref:Uncharacterized protein n=1 Tax=Oricola cellulosilytica TaxID=1429082 RepID=A0A4R0PFH3_9HYPH|nr:hypothetical protein [Oricola cellulosilytica]TCD15155.1 hypothetical protein E0D97_06295 [Oricola cellulosilytica]